MSAAQAKLALFALASRRPCALRRYAKRYMRFGATAPNRICDACLLRRLCLCPKVSITDTPADIPFRDPLGRGLPRSIIKKMTKKHFPTTALIHLTHEDIANTRFDVTKISLEDYQAISEMIAEKLNDGFVPLVKETIIEFYTYHKQLNS